ncbi:hypothetical protein [Methyloversatilis thermotolerans]|uniref:hypothetical protein n=1 Tax=Methyloversatilis thermotolerans TaxID=1346290 RepID=UPI00035E9E44|nr:hypothetical protein [Methyloversatilis thermotolerans]
MLAPDRDVLGIARGRALWDDSPRDDEFPSPRECVIDTGNGFHAQWGSGIRTGMRRLPPILSSLLAAVLLVTLLSPHFGWEMVAEQLEGHGLHAALDAHGHEASPAPPCAGTADDESHHHGCAAHQFSHIPGHLMAASTWSPALTRERVASADRTDFRSFFPPRLDRPPTHRDTSRLYPLPS